MKKVSITIMSAGLLLAGHTHAALVSHYTFDDNTNLGADSGTIGNTAGPGGDGDASFTAAAKVGAGALELDGDDSLFIGGIGPNYSVMDDDGDGFTVAAWVNIDPANGGNSRILSMAMGGGFVGEGFGVGFDLSNDVLATTYGQVDYNPSSTVPFSTWTHVAYRFGFNGGADIDTVEFFVNGVSVVTSDPAVNGMNNTVGTFSIGNINIPGNEQYFTGLIDDLRVYDTEISNGEIAALAVPEPSSAALLGLGGFALILRRRF